VQRITHDVTGVELEIVRVVGRWRKYYRRVQRVQPAGRAVRHKVDVGEVFRVAFQVRGGDRTRLRNYGLAVFRKMLFDAADFRKGVHQVVISGPR